MTEKRKGGFKEFMILIAWLVVLAAVYDIIDTAIRMSENTGKSPGQNLFLTVAVIVCGCVLVYLSMRHYAAAFTYTLTDKKLIITRKIGHREKSVEIKNKDMQSISKSRPRTGDVHSMKTAVFSEKRTRYITYSENGKTDTIAFEPSDDMADEILKRIQNEKRQA